MSSSGGASGSTASVSRACISVVRTISFARAKLSISTGTGLAPFVSLIKDPDVYERYESIVLVHGCRQVSELAYGEEVVEKLRSDEIFGEIETEHARATEYICKITRQHTVLEKTPMMQRSIDSRNPYVDPLNFIQVSLLAKLRGMNPDAPETAEAVVALLP